MRRGRSGFTLVEILVVLGVIAILVAIALPNITRVRDRAREAEVKNNLHDLQLALERYSTDQGGLYPAWIYGGDWTDSFSIPEDQQQYFFDQQPKQANKIGGIFEGTNVDQIPPWIDPAQPGDGDALVLYGYVLAGVYPRNPFSTNAMPDDLIAPLDQMLITQVSGPSSVQRAVGGFRNDRMWEISGGPPQTGLPTGDGTINGHPGWEFIYPVFPHDPVTNQIDQSRQESAGPVRLPGNFYYYAIPKRVAGVRGWYDYNPKGQNLLAGDAALNAPPIQVSSFYLIGYGGSLSKSNAKLDFYDNWGEFELHVRTARQGTVAPINPNQGGPDGLGDGAIVVLTGGEVSRPQAE